MPKTREPAFAWRSRCSIALPTSTPNGAAAGLNTRSASAWASIQVFATSEISAATIAWTTRSSARKRTWPRVCRIAEPGQIIISYETYVFVRDTIVARALPPIAMKGISREVIPYLVSGVLDASGKNVQVFSEHITGLDFYFNASMIDSSKAPHIRELLRDALKALDGS